MTDAAIPTTPPAPARRAQPDTHRTDPRNLRRDRRAAARSVAWRHASIGAAQFRRPHRTAMFFSVTVFVPDLRHRGQLVFRRHATLVQRQLEIAGGLLFSAFESVSRASIFSRAYSGSIRGGDARSRGALSRDCLAILSSSPDRLCAGVVGLFRNQPESLTAAMGNLHVRIRLHVAFFFGVRFLSAAFTCFKAESQKWNESVDRHFSAGRAAE